jgi:hypothetical protein
MCVVALEGGKESGGNGGAGGDGEGWRWVEVFDCGLEKGRNKFVSKCLCKTVSQRR